MQAIYHVGLCEEFTTLYEFLRLRCPNMSAYALQIHLTALHPRMIRRLIVGWICFRMSYPLENEADERNRAAAIASVLNQ